MYRPPPDIGGDKEIEKLKFGRRPFFAYEDGRWTYRRHGLGRAITVTRAEVASGSKRLSKVTQAITAFILVLLAGAGFVWSEWTGNEEVMLSWGPMVAPFAAMVLGVIVKYAGAAILFSKFERRPRFGREITIRDRMRQSIAKVAARTGLRPRDVILLLLLASPIIFIVFGTLGLGLKVALGGILIAVMASIVVHRINQSLGQSEADRRADEDDLDILLSQEEAEA